MTSDQFTEIYIKEVVRAGEEILTDKGTLYLSDKIKGFFNPFKNKWYRVQVQDELITFIDFKGTDELKGKPSPEEEPKEGGQKDDEPKQEEAPKKEEQKAKTLSPYDYRGLQSQVGGLTHDAVLLAIEEHKDSNKRISEETIKESVRKYIRSLKEIQDEEVARFKKEYEMGKSTRL